MRQISKLIFILFCCACGYSSIAQCVSSFPYNEDFELSNGGWTTGGISSDWAWGTPAKPVISSAGSGSKSWITGGLSNIAYNNAENSWLQSPCIDLTTMTSPRISFKIFWETERNFDGANLQYSIDGTSWQVLGQTNSDACIASNWYNTASINFLGAKPGWSGNIQTGGGACISGGGSGSWLTASHDISFLAGQPAVRFRFAFAAGTTCNSYDGFAIDDISILEAPPNNFTDFTYSCIGNNSVAFQSVSAGCNSPLWDFGDPASGNNQSVLPDPVHEFTTAGTYTVTLRNSASPGSAVIIKTISLLSVTTSVTDPIECNGGTGKLTATVTGSTGNHTYSWNSNPVQTTQTAINLPPGIYTVTVTAPGFCTTSSTVTLTQPAALTVSSTVVHAQCSNANGKITSVVNGGTVPYQYSWSNGGSTATLTSLNAGDYILTVTDANGCSRIVTYQVMNVSPNCSDVFFPSAFSPGNDQLNDLFGPLGNTLSLNNYSLKIFNRWGQEIFVTTDPLKKWNGTYKGKKSDEGIYLWYATYELNSENKTKKGTLMLIR